MSDEKSKYTIDEVVRLSSKVTPNLANKKRRDTALFILLLIICATIFSYTLLPQRKEGVIKEDKESKTPNATLSQNIAHLANLRDKARSSQEELNARLALRDKNHPPILRSHKKETRDTISPELRARMNAPTSFSESMEEGRLRDGGSTNSSQAKTVATLKANNANAEFINAQDEVVLVSAKRIPHPDFTVPADEMIQATLEVAMNSELPGLIKAVVKEDIYSLTGNNLLIPKGSSLHGQYNASVVQGQSRLLFVWNRLRRPDGVIVSLGSPGTDKIGRSGMAANDIDRHFLERFGSSILLSVLSGAAATTGVNGQDQYNSASQYRATIAASLQQASSQTLEENLNIRPTLSINQGSEISVFVARDLDFSSVGAFIENKSLSLPKRVWSQVWK